MVNHPLRVAFIDYSLEPDKPGRSGVSDVVWDMASELINQGHQAHMIGTYRTDRFPDPRVTVHNFPMPPIGYRNIVGHLWILKRALGVARQLQPDLIHAPEYTSTALFAALGSPAPLVLTVPGNIYHRIKAGHSYEWYYLQLLKLSARISARRCAAVIAISQEMKRWWEWTGSAPERTPWIPYGVDGVRFQPIANARQRLAIPDQQLFLLYVGRFAREKGLLDLVDALALLRDQLGEPVLKVVLVGRGPQEDELRQRIAAKQLGALVEVRSWLPQADLSLWYSAADALLLPSYTEGFARVIPEAMSCGTPVIGSQITGTEDHVHEGATGLLFPAGDSAKLAAVLERVTRDPMVLRAMRAPTLRYVREHLQWQSVMARIVDEVYQPIMAATMARSVPSSG